MNTITRKEEQILLAVYSLGEKAYLVNIREYIKDMTGNYLDLGTINKPLKRLESNGYLDSEIGDSSPVRGGRAKKYYRLSKAGIRALAEVKEQHEAFWKNVNLPYKTS